MIDLYTWTTPNGRKASIMLEEVGLPYTVKPINIRAGEQHTPEFLAISPNNKIPAIVDHEAGISLMESGAILLYLAKKTNTLWPADEATQWVAMQWLMFQMGGVGPMLGQVHHFLRFHPGKAPYAEERFHKEAQRLYKVLDTRLAENAYAAGAEYTIADVALWPWITRFEWHQIDFDQYPHVRRWYREIAARPAVQRGYELPHKTDDIPLPA